MREEKNTLTGHPFSFVSRCTPPFPHTHPKKSFDTEYEKQHDNQLSIRMAIAANELRTMPHTPTVNAKATQPLHDKLLVVYCAGFGTEDDRTAQNNQLGTRMTTSAMLHAPAVQERAAYFID